MTTTTSPGFDRLYDAAVGWAAQAVFLPAWSPDGKVVAFIEGEPDDRRAWSVDLASGERSELIDVARARDALHAATGLTPPGRGLPFAHLAFVGPRTIAFAYEGGSAVLDLDDYSVAQPPAPSMVDTMFELSLQARTTPKQFFRTQPLMDPQPAVEAGSPDGRYFASTAGGNVQLRSTADGRTMPLTTDGTTEVEWRFDVANPMMALLGWYTPVTNWSPDGSRLAAYRVDNTGVAQSPQVHWLKREDEVVPRYAAKAGGVLERVTLHVLNAFGGPPVDIDLGDTTDTYPVHAAWLPDSSGIVVVTLSRDCTRADVLLADAKTGTVRELFSEVGETFVRVHHEVYFARKLGLALTPDGSGLIWASERDGWRHLYLYDLQGRLVRQLTTGDFPVGDVVRVTDERVLLLAHHDQERPYDVHLLDVPLDGGPAVRLTAEPGVHSASFSPDGEFFIDTISRCDQVPVHLLRRADGSLVGELSRADEQALRSAGWSPSQQFTVTAADGETELWGVMHLPPDFDADRTYPVVEYVYGGPQVAVAPHGFVGMATKYLHALAQLGYVVIAVDGRGTPERSKEFIDVVVGDWAGPLVADHAAAIEQLVARHSFLDSGGAGVIGHSWGGYSAFRLMAERPDVYAAAVSSAPGFDPYSSVLYECYLGLPQDHRDAYDKASTYPLAAQVERPFMIAVGTSDHGTWTDSVKMAEALIQAGKDHEFVLLPEQYHGFSTAHDSYYLRQVQRFFGQHLAVAQSPARTPSSVKAG